MSTAGRLARVGAGRQLLGWSHGIGRHGRTTCSSSPCTRGFSGLFSGGERPQLLDTNLVYKNQPAGEAPKEGRLWWQMSMTEHYATSQGVLRYSFPTHARQESPERRLDPEQHLRLRCLILPAGASGASKPSKCSRPLVNIPPQELRTGAGSGCRGADSSPHSGLA